MVCLHIVGMLASICALVCMSMTLLNKEAGALLPGVWGLNAADAVGNDDVWGVGEVARVVWVVGTCARLTDGVC